MSEAIKNINLLAPGSDFAQISPQPARLIFPSDYQNFLGKGLECTAVNRVWVEGLGTPFAFKQMPNPDRVKRAMMVWPDLKSAHVSSPESLWGVEAEGVLLGTLSSDLTDGGNKLLLTNNGLKFSTFNTVREKNPELADYFLELDLNDSGFNNILENQIEELAETTAEGGVVLNGLDATGSILEPGSLSLVVFDLGRVVTRSPIDAAKIYADNKSYLDGVRLFIQDAQDIAQMA